MAKYQANGKKNPRRNLTSKRLVKWIFYCWFKQRQDNNSRRRKTLTRAIRFQNQSKEEAYRRVLLTHCPHHHGSEHTFLSFVPLYLILIISTVTNQSNHTEINKNALNITYSHSWWKNICIYIYLSSPVAKKPEHQSNRHFSCNKRQSWVLYNTDFFLKKHQADWFLLDTEHLKKNEKFQERYIPRFILW